MAAMKYLVLISAVVGVALAYSTGGPTEACGDLTPQHGVDAQKSPVPYTLSTSSNRVSRGQKIQVTLRGNGATDKIKGFLIQARDGTTPLGQFRIIDQLNSQLLDCNAKGNSVTHKKINENGVSQVVFEWIAPNDFQGRINFVGTVALNGGVFWNTLQSSSLAVV